MTITRFHGVCDYLPVRLPLDSGDKLRAMAKQLRTTETAIAITAIKTLLTLFDLRDGGVVFQNDGYEVDFAPTFKPKPPRLRLVVNKRRTT